MIKTKSGFVSIIGRPNVGKSSLMNRIIGLKVSIVTDTSNTTRDQIKGIYTDDEAQIVFLDTPGIHKPRKLLEEKLNEKTYSVLEDNDLNLFLQPIDEEIGPGDRKIVEKIKNFKKVAVITKIDKSNMEEVEKRVKELKSLSFDDVLAVSLDIKESVEELLKYIKESLNYGPFYFDEEDVTDHSITFITKEAIRETIINNTFEEVPHSIGIRIDEFLSPDPTRNKYEIHATIFVERQSQKGILIGEDGKKIKKIGVDTRIKLENLFQNGVVLKLKVKVLKNWTNDKDKIKSMGY